jgi:hypothetical protein
MSMGESFYEDISSSPTLGNNDKTPNQPITPNAQNTRLSFAYNNLFSPSNRAESRKTEQPINITNSLPTPNADKGAKILRTLRRKASAAKRDSPSNSNKPVRITASGKIHATARRITADLDDADRLILNMKDNNKSNAEVVTELRKLGINYDPKTVGTRYLRIKTVVSDNNDMINGRNWAKEEVSVPDCFHLIIINV